MHPVHLELAALLFLRLWGCSRTAHARSSTVLIFLEVLPGGEPLSTPLRWEVLEASRWLLVYPLAWLLVPSCK